MCGAAIQTDILSFVSVINPIEPLDLEPCIGKQFQLGITNQDWKPFA